MGNKVACCVSGSPQVSRAKQYQQWQPNSSEGNGGVVNASFPRDETILQHISEREGEDGFADPSTHPTTQTTFMERSKSDMRIKENRRSFYVLDHSSSFGQQLKPLRKSNSSSTIYLDDSTISQPNLKNTIKCISLAVYYHIAQRTNRANERLVDIFDERLHPIALKRIEVKYKSHCASDGEKCNKKRPTHPTDDVNRDPDHRSIYRFIRTLFHAAQLTAECAIITLVYIERLLSFAEMDLCGSNWRRVVLGAIMMASKVWEDQAVWNADYCQILRDCDVEDMNELERQFLELVEFNINVPSSVYAKYYYDLRTLAMANDLQLPLQPLSHERAIKLEALSMQCEERVTTAKSTRRKWSSTDRINKSSSGANVILS